LPKERRAMGFTLQSILKRVPMVVSPIIGGALIAAVGISAGMRTGFAITLALAAATVPIVLTINLPTAAAGTTTIGGVWQSFHAALKRLLISDIIIRTCEGMAEVFIILYVTTHTGVSIARYGILVAVQVTTAILIYIPSAKIADRIGRKPFVIVTFFCF